MNEKLGPYLLGPNKTDDKGIYQGDILELSAALPDNSVDLICTDPPYHREHTHLYGKVAEMGSRVLRPGGFVLAMCGGVYLADVMALMGAHLDFFFLFSFELSGQMGGAVRPRGIKAPIITRLKHMVAFSNGLEGKPRTVVQNPYKGGGNDKRYHKWGQDEQTIRYYVDCFTHPGDIVLDPFMGGGTTGYVCAQLGRRYLGFDVDPVAVLSARARVSDLQPMMALPEAHTAPMAI